MPNKPVTSYRPGLYCNLMSVKNINQFLVHVAQTFRLHTGFHSINYQHLNANLNHNLYRSLTLIRKHVYFVETGYVKFMKILFSHMLVDYYLTREICGC